MKEIVSTLIRNLFKICGPLLAAKGVVDEQNLELIGGALATIVGVVWGIIDAKQASKAKAEAITYKSAYKEATETFKKPSQTN